MNRVPGSLALVAARRRTDRHRPPPVPASRYHAVTAAPDGGSDRSGRSGRTTSTARPARPPIQPSGATTSAAAAGATTRRQYYTNSTRNAAHGRRRQPGDHRPPGERRLPVPLRHLPVHVGPVAHRADLHPDVRPVRGPHQDPPRARDLARVLDARRAATGRTTARSTSWRTSARSRTPCTARSTAPGTPAPAGIGAGVQLSERPVVRRRLPHVRGRLGAELDHLVRRRRAVPAPYAGRPGRQHRGSSTTRSS